MHSDVLIRECISIWSPFVVETPAVKQEKGSRHDCFYVVHDKATIKASCCQYDRRPLNEFASCVQSYKGLLTMNMISDGSQLTMNIIIAREIQFG